VTHARILMVDDELEVCRIVQRILTDEQYEVQVSHSVADAVITAPAAPVRKVCPLVSIQLSR
jgi:DNA-binding response OmpR family regulator